MNDFLCSESKMDSMAIPMDFDFQINSKKKKESKKRGNNQKFMTQYSKQWPCLRRSDLSDGYAFCTICVADFTINHGG